MLADKVAPAPFVVPAVRPVLSVPGGFSIDRTDAVTTSASLACAPSRAGTWAKEARLEPADLSVAYDRDVRGGRARFNVADAGGYHGARKCNLFALEIAHRSGFVVPVVARAHGFGFPGADRMARDAGRGEVGAWAQVEDGASREALSAARARGACLLAVGAAPGAREGHVVVVDRIERIERGADGAIRRLSIAGWDAGSSGARYREVTLALSGSGGRFDELHLVSLRRGKGPVLVDESTPGASRLDLRRA